jgi:dTDP-glucose 4,6-dehydratase
MIYEKTILVTGGSGFIGSNYLNYAVAKYPNYRFVNLDALTYAANQENITVSTSPNYIFAKGDIRDVDAIEKVFKEYSPTHIIHFAAESHVDNSITGPSIFVETNVLGTQNLLEVARKNNITRFHHISTDEVYGSLDADASASVETDSITPNSPYSASKAGSDLLVRSYHHTFGLDTVTTRASNNYGPSQHVEKLIPRFITNLLLGKKVPVYGTGENVRDWIHVSDHVLGIDAAFHKGTAGEIYNLGGGNEIQNIDITKKLIALAGLGEEMIEHATDRLGHDIRYALDSSKATRDLGWKPEKDFETGLAETFEYYKNRGA